MLKEELHEKTWQLQKDLMKLLCNYQQETGLTVRDIDVQTVANNARQYEICSVRLSLENL